MEIIRAKASGGSKSQSIARYFKRKGNFSSSIFLGFLQHITLWTYFIEAFALPDMTGTLCRGKSIYKAKADAEQGVLL